MRSLVRSAIVLSALTGAALVSASSAHAQILSIFDEEIIPQQQVAYSTNFTLDKFNSAFGTLVGIRIDLTTGITATANVGNFGNGAPNPAFYSQITASIPVTITAPSTGLNVATTATAVRNFNPSESISFGELDTYNGLTATSSTFTNVGMAGFADYTGTSGQTIALNANAGNATVAGTGDQGIFYAGSGAAGATIRITYSYVATPEPSAFALLAFGLGPVGIVVRRRVVKKRLGVVSDEGNTAA